MGITNGKGGKRGTKKGNHACYELVQRGWLGVLKGGSPESLQNEGGKVIEGDGVERIHLGWGDRKGGKSPVLRSERGKSSVAEGGGETR